MNSESCFRIHESRICVVETTGRRSAWTLLTSHGHVLVEIARDPRARIRDLSAAAGLTERATAAIIADLEAAGYVTRTKVGRRNNYHVNLDNPFRHQAQRDLKVGPFLRFLTQRPPGGGGRTEAA
jgi:hypothetical protein